MDTTIQENARCPKNGKMCSGTLNDSCKSVLRGTSMQDTSETARSVEGSRYPGYRLRRRQQDPWLHPLPSTRRQLHRSTFPCIPGSARLVKTLFLLPSCSARTAALPLTPNRALIAAFVMFLKVPNVVRSVVNPHSCTEGPFHAVQDLPCVLTTNSC